jgi:predicted acyl esterase
MKTITTFPHPVRGVAHTWIPLSDRARLAARLWIPETADPLLAGASWREMWKERLDKSGLWLAEWLSHQRRDDYWRYGSVCEDFDAIRCPVMAVSGWADGYSNAVFRLLAGLKTPRKGLIGPWSHKYPHFGVPGPAIGFLQEALRWWDAWLKGEETGIMEEPMLRVWMQDSVAPSTRYGKRPGRWVAEASWPSGRIAERREIRVPANGVDGAVKVSQFLFGFRQHVRQPVTAAVDQGVNIEQADKVAFIGTFERLQHLEVDIVQTDDKDVFFHFLRSIVRDLSARPARNRFPFGQVKNITGRQNRHA